MMQKQIVRLPVLKNVNDLSPGQRRIITSKGTGRSIVLIRHPVIKDKIYCMDALCYHMGGPLGQSGDLVDIEEIGLGLKCPTHDHVISLEDGGLIKAGHCAPLNTNPSNCRKQRTHQVEIDEHNRVWVVISSGNQMESDKYNIARTIERSSTVPSSSRKRSSGTVQRSQSMLQFRSRKLQATEAIMRKLNAKKDSVACADESKLTLLSSTEIR